MGCAAACSLGHLPARDRGPELPARPRQLRHGPGPRARRDRHRHLLLGGARDAGAARAAPPPLPPLSKHMARNTTVHVHSAMRTRHMRNTLYTAKYGAVYLCPRVKRRIKCFSPLNWIIRADVAVYWNTFPYKCTSPIRGEEAVGVTLRPQGPCVASPSPLAPRGGLGGEGGLGGGWGVHYDPKAQGPYLWRTQGAAMASTPPAAPAAPGMRSDCTRRIREKRTAHQHLPPYAKGLRGEGCGALTPIPPPPPPPGLSCSSSSGRSPIGFSRRWMTLT